MNRILLLLWFSHAASATAVELIADNTFQCGLIVNDREGLTQTIRWHTNTAPPVWLTAQHHSKSSFADKAHQKITANGFAFQDDYETLFIHPGNQGGDFICAINAWKEYDGKFRTKGDPWPHLYLTQRISGPSGHLGTNAPSLAEIAKIDFAMQARLLHDRKPVTDRPTLAAAAVLYFGLATSEQGQAVAHRLGRDFLKPGGFTTTLIASGQQWDAPNGWPPLEWLTVVALCRYDRLARADSARGRWLALNRRTYAATGKMTEKYDVADPNRPAGGGEYPNQDGFGWTNGVALAFAAQVRAAASGSPPAGPLACAAVSH